MAEVTIDLPGNPRPAPRPRRSKHGGVFMPGWYQAIKTEWSLLAENQMILQSASLLTGRLGVDVTFRRATRQTADIDNLFKTWADALNKVVWGDDVQIDRAIIAVERGVGEKSAGVTP